MKGRERYYKLDDIGFVGVQEKKSRAEEKRIQKEMGELIQAHREAEAKRKRKSKKAS